MTTTPKQFIRNDGNVMIAEDFWTTGGKKVSDSDTGPITASQIDSQSATNGQVLTANGSGAASFQDAGGGADAETLVHEKDLTLNTDVPLFSIPVTALDAFAAVMHGAIVADDGTDISVTSFTAHLAAFNKGGTSPDESGNIQASESKFASDGTSLIPVSDNSTFLIKNALSAGVITFSARLNTFGLTPTTIKLHFNLGVRTGQVVTYL